jgi:hypothetical protein
MTTAGRCGTRWRSWLRHCATSRKVAVSISDGVFGVSLEIFIDVILCLHCGPGVDLALDRNLYQAYFLGGKGNWCIGLISLPSSCVDFLKIPVALTFWIPKGLPRLVDGPFLLPRRGKPRYRPNAH